MTLSNAGEARRRGYLYVFERSLRAAQPPALVFDAVREVESHVRDRVAVAILTAAMPTQFGLEIGAGHLSFGPFSGAPGRATYSGWTIVVLCLVLGLAVMVITHTGARAWIRWIRTRIKRKERL